MATRCSSPSRCRRCCHRGWGRSPIATTGGRRCSSCARSPRRRSCSSSPCGFPGLVPLFGLVLLRARFAAVAAPAMGAAVPASSTTPTSRRPTPCRRRPGDRLDLRSRAAAGAAVRRGSACAVCSSSTRSRSSPSAAVGGARCRADHRAATATRNRRPCGPTRSRGCAHLWRAPVLRALALGFWLMVLASASDDLFLVFLGPTTSTAARRASACCSSAASVGLLLGLVTITRWTGGTPASAFVPCSSASRSRRRQPAHRRRARARRRLRSLRSCGAPASRWWTRTSAPYVQRDDAPSSARPDARQPLRRRRVAVPPPATSSADRCSMPPTPARCSC